MRQTWGLPADPGAPRQARAHVAQALADHADVDDAVLIASELAANAVEHGTPPIELALEVTGDDVCIIVSGTQSGTVPQMRTATTDDPRGRGLAIVASLSRDWGWNHEGGRLSVWAKLSSRRPPTV